MLSRKLAAVFARLPAVTLKLLFNYGITGGTVARIPRVWNACSRDSRAFTRASQRLLNDRCNYVAKTSDLSKLGHQSFLLLPLLLLLLPSLPRARERDRAVSKRGKAWNEEVDYTDNRVGREFGRALRNRSLGQRRSTSCIPRSYATPHYSARRN